MSWTSYNSSVTVTIFQLSFKCTNRNARFQTVGPRTTGLVRFSRQPGDGRSSVKPTCEAMPFECESFDVIGRAVKKKNGDYQTIPRPTISPSCRIASSRSTWSTCPFPSRTSDRGTRSRSPLPSGFSPCPRWPGQKRKRFTAETPSKRAHNHPLPPYNSRVHLPGCGPWSRSCPSETQRSPCSPRCRTAVFARPPRPRLLDRGLTLSSVWIAETTRDLSVPRWSSTLWRIPREWPRCVLAACQPPAHEHDYISQLRWSFL